MKKLLWIIPCLLLGMVIGYFMPHRVTYTVPKMDTVWYKVDSIQTVIDTLTIKETQVIHVYEKNEKDIMDNSVSDDYDYFTSFLRSRFPSNNNW